MHKRVLSVVAAVAIALIAALAVSTSGVLAHEDERSSKSKPGTAVVTGNVSNRLVGTTADIEQHFTKQTVTATFNGPGGPETHTFTGALLVDVLAKAGPRFDPAIKNDKLRHYISVTASDGYQTLLGYGEIDPGIENKKVLLATTQDGRSLAAEGPRLVVPGDRAGARFVYGVVKIKLDKPGR